METGARMKETIRLLHLCSKLGSKKTAELNCYMWMLLWWHSTHFLMLFCPPLGALIGFSLSEIWECWRLFVAFAVGRLIFGVYSSFITEFRKFPVYIFACTGPSPDRAKDQIFADLHECFSDNETTPCCEFCCPRAGQKKTFGESRYVGLPKKSRLSRSLFLQSVFRVLPCQVGNGGAQKNPQN